MVLSLKIPHPRLPVDKTADECELKDTLRDIWPVHRAAKVVRQEKSLGDCHTPEMLMDA